MLRFSFRRCNVTTFGQTVTLLERFLIEFTGRSYTSEQGCIKKTSKIPNRAKSLVSSPDLLSSHFIFLFLIIVSQEKLKQALFLLQFLFLAIASAILVSIIFKYHGKSKFNEESYQNVLAKLLFKMCNDTPLLIASSCMSILSTCCCAHEFLAVLKI